MLAQVPLRTDRGYPTKLQDTDEAPVNAALIFLLHQITEVARGSTALWRHPRVHFEAIFGTFPGGAGRSIVAITDGQLQSTTTHEVKVVVECKSAKMSPRAAG
ncbi:uncharacterized protein APUU_21532A [Aspergillus puulaauensis]|uniref:Uncharacterized protein n=1 Tax=Aspergillus puulaauensis TaxID=1220207 RepID=A0A7R8AKW4_9EURO|nr:uncharacterized protein APUU_21532A [Aspergillus puulaauensis]BCS21100.1 hypothetical protein APUU_21532A [Aspergillus puulaauensis]